MTKAVRNRILKDVNGSFSDHLRNHIHLTNCIHLKNHMHKNSPILADRAFTRDLVVLQRSKSLRDPSASPPTWHTSSVVDALHKRGERDTLVNPRQYVGMEKPTLSGKMSGGSSISLRKSKADGLQVNGDMDGILERKRVKKEELSRKSLDIDAMRRHGDHLQCGSGLESVSVSGNSDLRDKSVKKKTGGGLDKHIETLHDQLKNVIDESDDDASSRNIENTRQSQKEKLDEEVEDNGRSLHRAKRRRFRQSRRNRPSVAIREDESQNEMSVASNLFGKGRVLQKYRVEKGARENDNQNINGVPKNGCGIPWNWSTIHHRGKSLLDMAGRNLSCGLSGKKGGSFSQGMEIHETALESERASSSPKSVGEALPLLLGASGSQGSIDNAAWHHDYSGELGICASNLLKQEMDSDLASEGRSHEQHKFRRQPNDMHQNITEKYMPRTFRDLVGQNLVVQALSNAITKRKIGLLYVFYGPHGTGKTSCARTFARALNCQSLEHSKPCGFCNSCIEHDMGKNQNIREVGPVGNNDFDGIIEIVKKVVASQLKSQYRVIIFDELDTLSSDSWSAILKVTDRYPTRAVFIIVCSTLEVLPHIIISRCQKFFFPKLKDADIIYTLQWIATKEELEIDKDALKLIASRSDGSLRDAEMTLEQLSLLGQRISLCLVQELVGLIADEKLIDLLDLALSADTINTVKNLRDIMESGVEPLALISQLATVITDILAGNYDFLIGRSKKKFFRQQTLTKEDMEKLRQALRTLSEAEKQLRVSNDRMTWLTAALLQLAPDQQYMLPGSSADTSINHSPLPPNNGSLKVRSRKSNAEMRTAQVETSGDVYRNANLKGIRKDGKYRVPDGVFSQQLCTISNDKNKSNTAQLQDKYNQELEEIWLEVLEKIPVASIKEFMYQDAKLISVSYVAAPVVQLLFNSQLTKSMAEKFRLHILDAFEAVLRSPVTIEIRCSSRKDIGAVPILLQPPEPLSHLDANTIIFTSNGMPSTNHCYTRRILDKDTSSAGVGRSEIVEIETAVGEHKYVGYNDDKMDFSKPQSEYVLARTTPQRTSTSTSFQDHRRLNDRSQSLGLVRSRLSLAHVIQHTETCSHQSGWSKHKSVSIAEKLEQENLRLEPRSRRLFCWNPPRVSGCKLSRMRIRTRKPHTLLKFVSCGRCISSRSSRY